MQRLLQPLSPSWVASKVGVTRQQVDRWKNGYYVTEERLADVADAVRSLLPEHRGATPAPAWAEQLERKLDVLVAKAGVDPVDVQDEDEARRLVEEALQLVQHAPGASGP